MQKVFGDRDGERGAFFGVGRGAKLVKQDERGCIRSTRDAIDVDDVRRKRRKILLNRLRIADVRIDCREERELRTLRRNGHSGLRH